MFAWLRRPKRERIEVTTGSVLVMDAGMIVDKDIDVSTGGLLVLVPSAMLPPEAAEYAARIIAEHGEQQRKDRAVKI